MADQLISTTYVYVTDNANNTGTATGLAISALNRMTSSIDTMLTSQVNVVFKTPSQMKSGGATLPDGSAAWGYTFKHTRECWINNAINGGDLPSEKTQYTVLHELGHMVDHDMLNAAKRTTLMGLMSPAATTWDQGTYIQEPDECFGDTFPRAWAGITTVLTGYYGRQIASGSWATYRTTITGAGSPFATTLAATANSGVTNIKVASVTDATVDAWITVGTDASPDDVKITSVGTAGPGGTGISFSPATTVQHGSGAAVTEIDPPNDGGGTGGQNPAYSLTIGGVDYTGRIPADSFHISESGSDAVATLEFTIETFPGQSRLQGSWAKGEAGDEFPADSVFLTNLATGARVFGGTLVGSTRRHLAGPGVAQDIRCVSFDAWLDRRYLAKWWTTTTGTQSGNKLTTDRLIVQAIISAGCSWLVAPDATIASTNVAMPKMNLDGGSLRDMILTVAEQAATVADPTARRVYVDFNEKVHYFKGTEGTSAPYRVGDASYTSTVRATSGLYSFWPMAEGTGATAYDAISAKSMTLSGTYARGVPGGVVNEPGNRAVNFAGGGGAVATSASYATNVFSLEMWFQRGLVGSEQTLVDTGTAGYTLEFDSSDHLKLYKRGTGTDFITTGTFTDMLWHHLVVTHNGSATHIYVDGNDKAGTATLRTFVPPANDLYFAKLSDGTLKFNGSLQDVAFYTSVITGATVTAHYNDGVTVVPDYIEHDLDFNDSGFSVYVAGTGISGWANVPAISPYGANTIIDRPEVTNQSMLDAAATAFLKRDFAPNRLIRFTVVGFDGWRAGQTVAIDDAGLGINGSFEIKSIDTINETGSGVWTYDISAGSLPWRGHYDIKRKRRNNVGGPVLA